MADEKIINTDMVSSYITDKNYGDKIKNVDEIAKIVATAFASVANNGFLPAGDIQSNPDAAPLAAQWNKSLEELYRQLKNPSEALSNGNLTYNMLLSADAKGTEARDYLDPSPLKNRLDQTYEEARSDEFPMNVAHMDYTNDIGDAIAENVQRAYEKLMKVLDVNGDGVVDGIMARETASEDDQSDASIGDVQEWERIFLQGNISPGQMGIPLYTLISSFETEDGVLTEDALEDYLINRLSLGTEDHYSYDGTERFKYFYKAKNGKGQACFLVVNSIALFSNVKSVNPVVVSPTGPYKKYYEEIMGIESINEDDYQRKVYKILLKMCGETMGERLKKFNDAVLDVLNLTGDERINLLVKCSIVKGAIQNLPNTNNYLSYRQAAESLYTAPEHNAIRLLMPQYARRVEVEDLNKNFWVIGQVLDALTQGLVGPKGVYPSLQKMLDELGQLWQNTSYIWNVLAAVANRDVRYYDNDIEEINNELDAIKKALGFGEVDKVDWLIEDVVSPHVALTQSIPLNTFKVRCSNQYGTRDISDIIRLSRIRPEKGTFNVAPVHYSIPDSEFDGAYDMRGTIEKMNRYLTTSIDNDKRVELVYLTISNDGMKTQADFTQRRVPAFISEEEKEKDYNADKCFSVFANKEENAETFFRVIPNFSIVCYDENYYDVNFEEVDTDVIVEKFNPGDDRTELKTISVKREVAKITCKSSIQKAYETYIETYELVIRRLEDERVQLQKDYANHSSRLISIQRIVSTLTGEEREDAEREIQELQEALNDITEELLEIREEIEKISNEIGLTKELVQQDEQEKLNIFQDSPDKIIIYLPHKQCYEGDIFKIDFKDFYLQDCIPKTNRKNEQILKDGTEEQKKKIIEASEQDNYWNGQEYRAWRSTFDRISDGEEIELQKKTYKDGQEITDKLKIKRPTFDVHNKIIVTYRNKNMLPDKYLENSKKYLNVSLTRTDLVDAGATANDIGSTVVTKETKYGTTYDKYDYQVQYQNFERWGSNITTYCMPGVIQNGVAYQNIAKGMVINDLITTANDSSSLRANWNEKEAYSLIDHSSIESAVKALTGEEKEKIYPIFGVYSSLKSADFTESNKGYYPNTMFYMHAITYPHMYDYAITSILVSTEAQNVNYRSNQLSRIKLYGAKEGQVGGALSYWTQEKVPTNYWRIQTDKVTGDIGDRDVIVDFVTDEEYKWQTGHHFYGYYPDFASYYFTPFIEDEEGNPDYFIGYRNSMLVESKNGRQKTLGDDPIESNDYVDSRLRSKEIYIGAIMQQPTARRKLEGKLIDTTICMPFLYTKETPDKYIVNEFIQNDYSEDVGTKGNSTIIDVDPSQNPSTPPTQDTGLTKNEQDYLNNTRLKLGDSVKADDIIWKTYGGTTSYAYHKATCTWASRNSYNGTFGVLSKEKVLEQKGKVAYSASEDCCGCTEKFVKSKFGIE